MNLKSALMIIEPLLYVNKQTQQSYQFLFKDYVITLDLVEELLIGVILGTGDKDAG